MTRFPRRSRNPRFPPEFGDTKTSASRTEPRPRTRKEEAQDDLRTISSTSLHTEGLRSCGLALCRTRTPGLKPVGVGWGEDEPTRRPSLALRRGAGLAEMPDSQISVEFSKSTSSMLTRNFRTQPNRSRP